jgi:type I restriction enzyme S subunit
MKYKIKDIVTINPTERLRKNSIAKKISMDKLKPFCRDIPEYTLSAYSGGAKFRNGDTLMARITPCLENGKIAKVNVLDENEVGFGSTEFIVFRAINGISDEDYVYYLISSPKVRDVAVKSMVGSSGRQRAQTEVIANLEVEVPDLIAQKKIASVLKSIDDKILLNNQINDNLSA